MSIELAALWLAFVSNGAGGQIQEDSVGGCDCRFGHIMLSVLRSTDTAGVVRLA